MILYLGLEREDYDRYLSGEEGKGYSACLRKAGCAARASSSGICTPPEKATTGKIFLARQSNNGGLSDKQSQAPPAMTVDVTINGGKTAVSSTERAARRPN